MVVATHEDIVANIREVLLGLADYGKGDLGSAVSSSLAMGTSWPPPPHGFSLMRGHS
jgi:hypothetical protein